MDLNKYQIDIALFLINRKKRDKDDFKKTTTFKLKDFPLFYKDHEIDEMAEKTKKVTKTIREENDVFISVLKINLFPCFDRCGIIESNIKKLRRVLMSFVIKNGIEVKNLEILNSENLIGNHNSNKEIRIKYKRTELEDFLSKLISKNNPNKFFLRDVKQKNKTKIWYNGNVLDLRYNSKMAILIRLIFGLIGFDVDEYYEENLEEYDFGLGGEKDINDPFDKDGDISTPKTFFDKYYHTLNNSINNIIKDYIPGETMIDFNLLTCLYYYSGDRHCLDPVERHDEIIKNNNKIDSFLRDINKKALEKIGIKIFDIYNLNKPDHNKDVCLGKLGEIQEF